MEEKNKINLFSVILIMIIIFLVVEIICMFLKNQKLNNLIIEYDSIAISTNNNSLKEINETDTLANQLSEKNETIEKETNEFEKPNSENQSLNSNDSYEIRTIKNIYDVISTNDTKLAKAQKIAKEVMNAVNNKDWYYLAKMVGTDADYFIKYGIYNYNINVDDYQEINGEYIFNETYETYLPVNESIGKMLIIKFENDGRIVIDTNCTGI